MHHYRKMPIFVLSKTYKHYAHFCLVFKRIQLHKPYLALVLILIGFLPKGKVYAPQFEL